MDDLVDAIRNVLERRDRTPTTAEQGTRDVLTAILRVHAGKPSPLEAAYHAGAATFDLGLQERLGVDTFDALTRRGFEQWNQTRSLDTRASPVLNSKT